MNKNPPRQASKERFYKKHVHDWIHLDIFRIGIPIFTSEDACAAFCAYEGVEFQPSTHAVFGSAGWGQDRDGHVLFYVVLPPHSNTNTWVHEASHLVDFIIDHLGLEPGIQGTETRAYMLGHIFSSIEAAMLPTQLPAVVTQAPYNEIPA